LQKKEWREQFRQRLLDLDPQARRTAEKRLVARLSQILKAESGIWGGFQAHTTEPNLGEVFSALDSIRWAFPVVQGQELHWWIPGQKGFHRGAFAVSEPVLEGATVVDKEDLQGFLVPGLGFDHAGVRLGRGAGYFDRNLAGVKGKKIGICFACQMVKELPGEEHDVRMDFVITENELVRTG